MSVLEGLWTVCVSGPLWAGLVGCGVCGALGRPVVVACGSVGWCMGLWSWVACGARAPARLRVYCAEGLPGSGACCRRIRGARHGSPPCR